MFNTLSDRLQNSFDTWIQWNVDMEYCLQHNLNQEDLRSNDELVEAFLVDHQRYVQSMAK
jgi:nicotinamide riboside kinase